MSAKQVTQIRMGAYIYNGAPLDMTSFRAFTTFPQTYKVWNINYQYNADFLGGAVQDTLSGYQRGNPMGHRLNVTINLNNSLPTDTEAIRNLLNRCASRYDRFFFPIAGVSVSGGSQLSFTNTGLATDYFRALTVQDGSGKQRLIASSTATTLTTASPLGDWNTSNNFIVAKPSHPTIIGVSFDNTDANIKYFNLASESFGLNRELTVGNSIIQMSLTGVFSDAVMDSNIVMQ
jgi:hypothetical protein